MDTHPVSEMCGGNGNGIVAAVKVGSEGYSTMTNWLFCRIGKHHKYYKHNMVVLEQGNTIMYKHINFVQFLNIVTSISLHSLSYRYSKYIV